MTISDLHNRILNTFIEIQDKIEELAPPNSVKVIVSFSQKHFPRFHPVITAFGIEERIKADRAINTAIDIHREQLLSLLEELNKEIDNARNPLHKR